MSTTEAVQSTNSDAQPSETNPRPGRREPSRDGQPRQASQGGQKRPEGRVPVSPESVIQEVTNTLKSDRNAAGRIVAATGRNAVVLLARSSMGKTLFDTVSDVDRAMFVLERSSARGFDIAKVTRRSELEKRLFEHFSAIATITAETIVEFDVKDYRDTKVKQEVDRIRKEKQAIKADKNNAPA